MLTQLAGSVSTALAYRRIPQADFTPEISETEQALADLLSRLCAVKWHQQVRFKTAFCNFYLDMGCRIAQGRAIGLECDGPEFHRDKVRDFCRDALILGTGRLACIYRLEAWAVRNRQFDWLRIFSVLEPGLFTPQRHQTIRELGYSGDQVIGLRLENRSFGFMSRRSSEIESVRKFLEFASANQGIPFSELVERKKGAGSFIESDK